MFYRRKRFFKIARIIAMFVIGLIVAVFIAFTQVNLETLRGDLITGLQDATGLPVEINGKISWKFSLRPKVELNDVNVLLKSVRDGKNNFSAKKIDVTLNLFSLLRNNPTIQNIKIYDAVLFVKQDEQDEKIDNNKNIKEKSKTDEVINTSKSKYPFNIDFGLDSIELKNFNVYVGKSEYSLDGFYISSNSKKNAIEYSGWLKFDQEIYPFILQFSEFNEERKVYPVRLALSVKSKALVANVALEGKSKLPIDFILKGSIPNIKLIGNIFNQDLPETPPLDVNMAGGFGTKSFTLRKSSVSIGGSEFDISGIVDWSSVTPAININIKSENFDLNELFPNLYSSEKEWIRPKRKLNVFKDTPLYGEFLKNYNLNLNISANKLKIYRDMVAENLNTNLYLKDAKLHVDTKTKFADGDVSAVIEVQTDNNDKLFVRAAGLGERIYVGEIMEEIREKDSISELPTNFEFYLEATGFDLSELMSTVTGPLYVYSVAPGYANAKIISYLYGEDFLTSLRHNIQDMFRSKKKYDQITVSCAAINLKIRNGIVETTNGIAVETNAINMMLAGNVNLGKETLKTSMTTVPVRGLKLSITGNVINSIEFSGELAEPDIKINSAAVAGKFASATGIGLMLAPFTGGIGLVAGAGVGLLAGGLLENWLSDEHPCKTAMEKGVVVKTGDPDWLNKPMAELVGNLIK
ncbi:MAG: AsmA family protein [Alphaproteobacteria bacterium]|nr:AsmA family protein [Alphaproteobacteria bacterium]MBN2675155.1 AsmA family protein [Alphaproteobacteria bacterium]